jgi:hypothetical protein
MADTKKLAKELADVDEGTIVLVETAIENAPEVGLDAIRTMVKKGFTGIIVSASRPYTNLVAVYEKGGIDTKKVFIIDCVTKASSVEPKEAANVAYLDSVSDLTTMSLAINNAIETIEGKKFVFLDSISTMLIYNRPDIFAKFVHIMMTKMRVGSVSGILISFESENNKEVRAEIVQLCDRVIKV